MIETEIIRAGTYSALKEKINAFFKENESITKDKLIDIKFEIVDSKNNSSIYLVLIVYEK